MVQVVSGKTDHGVSIRDSENCCIARWKISWGNNILKVN